MLSLISQPRVASFCAVFIRKSAVRGVRRLSVTKQVRMDLCFLFLCVITHTCCDSPNIFLLKVLWALPNSVPFFQCSSEHSLLHVFVLLLLIQG